MHMRTGKEKEVILDSVHAFKKCFELDGQATEQEKNDVISELK